MVKVDQLKRYYESRVRVDSMPSFENLDLEFVNMLSKTFGFSAFVTGEAIENLGKAITTQFNKIYPPN